jgi:hypothetical protein
MTLVRKELVRPDRAVLPGEDAIRFRHLLIREAAYEALAKADWADLHERFARWPEERESLVELDEITGHHLEQACSYRCELVPADDKARQLAADAAAAAPNGDDRSPAVTVPRAPRQQPGGYGTRRRGSQPLRTGDQHDQRRPVLDRRRP